MAENGARNAGSSSAGTMALECPGERQGLGNDGPWCAGGCRAARARGIHTRGRRRHLGRLRAGGHDAAPGVDRVRSVGRIRGRGRVARRLRGGDLRQPDGHRAQRRLAPERSAAGILGIPVRRFHLSHCRRPAVARVAIAWRGGNPVSGGALPRVDGGHSGRIRRAAPRQYRPLCSLPRRRRADVGPRHFARHLRAAGDPRHARGGRGRRRRAPRNQRLDAGGRADDDHRVRRGPQALAEPAVEADRPRGGHGGGGADHRAHRGRRRGPARSVSRRDSQAPDALLPALTADGVVPGAALWLRPSDHGARDRRGWFARQPARRRRRSRWSARHRAPPEPAADGAGVRQSRVLDVWRSTGRLLVASRADEASRRAAASSSRASPPRPRSSCCCFTARRCCS